jgi:hypothetical protein
MALTRVKPQGLTDEGVAFMSTPTWTTGVNTYDFRNGPVFYHAFNTPSANWTANFTNVPTTYATNQSTTPTYGGLVVEMTLMAQIGTTGYYPNAMQIDGTSVAVTWQGTQSTINKLNIWTIRLIRVGSTWTKILVKTVEAY